MFGDGPLRVVWCVAALTDYETLPEYDGTYKLNGLTRTYRGWLRIMNEPETAFVSFAANTPCDIHLVFTKIDAFNQQIKTVPMRWHPLLSHEAMRLNAPAKDPLTTIINHFKSGVTNTKAASYTVHVINSVNDADVKTAFDKTIRLIK